MPRQKQQTRAKQSGPQSVHFAKFDGLNTALPRTDIKPTELSACTNFDLDKDGKASVRGGRVKKFSGKWRSVWTDGRVRFGVQDGNLMQIQDDFTTLTLIRANVGDAHVSFAARYVRRFAGVPRIPETYYTNGAIIGYIMDGVSYDLANPTEKYKAVMLPGQILGFLAGRLYVCRGDTMWFSDVGHPNRRHLGSSGSAATMIQLPAPIVLWIAVDDGMYVSTTEKIYYLNGLDPTDKAMTARVVEDFPAKPNKAVHVDAKLFGKRRDDHLYGSTVVMDTARGLCYCTNGGIFGNISERKFVEPEGNSGAMVYRQNVINQVLNTVF